MCEMERIKDSFLANVIMVQVGGRWVLFIVLVNIHNDFWHPPTAHIHKRIFFPFLFVENRVNSQQNLCSVKTSSTILSFECIYSSVVLLLLSMVVPFVQSKNQNNISKTRETKNTERSFQNLLITRPCIHKIVHSCTQCRLNMQSKY